MRGFRTSEGGALVHLQNVSGGVVGGDTLETTIDVGRFARAQLTTVGATQVYRSSGAREARNDTRIRVAEGGLVEYLPDPLIPFSGSRYRQSTTVDLQQGAGALWWEIIAPGRIARGERFTYQHLFLESVIRVTDRPIAIERFAIQPSAQRGFEPCAPRRIPLLRDLLRLLGGSAGRALDRAGARSQ